MDEKIMLQNEMRALSERRDYDAEIVSVIRSNFTPKVIKEKISSYHENDIALAMDDLTVEERKKLYSVLGTDLLANVLEYSENFEKYLCEINLKIRAEILSKLEPDFLTMYLRELEEEERDKLVKLMDEETKEEVTLISAYEEDEIGSRMTTNFVSIKAGCEIRQAMKEVVSQAADNDNISTIYVVDEDNSFVGALDLKDLIIARDGVEISSITSTSYPYFYAFEKIDDCIERIKDYSEDSLPVLDVDNKLCGVIISQDVTELVEEEMSEDYAKLAGLASEEDLREPLRKSISKRLPWLVILLALGLMVSAVVGIFENVVAHIAIIVSFQSLILGMAGNVGTQSLAVTIRVLTDEEVGKKEKLYLMAKELKVGVINGLLLGIISFILVGLYLMIFKANTLEFSFAVSACTALALFLAIILSSLSGTGVPMLFKRLKIDPAVASGPLITTINDLVAVVAYYGLSWLFLIQWLGL